MSDEDNKKVLRKAHKAGWYNYYRKFRHFTSFYLKYLTYKFTLWSALRTIGSQKVIQFTILIPVIGYYIIFSEQFCSYTASHLPIGTSCSDNNPSQKTFEIYFAFVLIGTASLLYSIFCPKLIKRYENEIKLIHSENKHLTDVEISKYAKIIGAGHSNIGLRTMNNEIQAEPSFHDAGFLDYANDMIKDKHREIGLNKDDELITYTEQDNAELKQLRVNAQGFIVKIKKNIDGFLRAAYIAENCTLLKTRITISILYLFGFLILLKTGVSTFFSIYLIYYNSTPTHFVREIVEYVSTLFIY